MTLLRKNNFITINNLSTYHDDFQKLNDQLLLTLNFERSFGLTIVC